MQAQEKQKNAEVKQGKPKKRVGYRTEMNDSG